MPPATVALLRTIYSQIASTSGLTLPLAGFLYQTPAPSSRRTPGPSCGAVVNDSHRFPTGPRPAPGWCMVLRDMPTFAGVSGKGRDSRIVDRIIALPIGVVRMDAAEDQAARFAIADRRGTGFPVRHARG